MAEEHKMLILYDGNCRICCAKRDFLKRRDRNGKLAFSDIRTADFQSLEIPVPMSALEREIHLVRADGQLLVGMEVIRAAYREIGLGWLAAPTGWPLLRPLFNRFYRFVADHRTSISSLKR